MAFLDSSSNWQKSPRADQREVSRLGLTAARVANRPSSIQLDTPKNFLEGTDCTTAEREGTNNAMRLRGMKLTIQKPGLALRIFEVVVAGLGLVVFSPIIIGIALVIRKGTAGPALFFQQRVGAGFRKFSFCKFRTLYADAKERFPELYEYKYNRQEIETLKFKEQNDPRITPQGAWLRKSSLDELPNFWNVLTGDMALVGPRPEIPEMLPYYEGEMLKKFSVRPGITGLAQVSGRGDLTFRETVEYDVEYVNNKSFWLDVKIVLRTLCRIITRDGAF